MEERENLEKAIQGLESQREQLGDAAVDAAVEILKRRLVELESPPGYVEEEPASEHIAERRVVTVLFCDVAGSTKLAEGMDPEAWTGIMNAAFEHLIEPVERYGGTIARLMGDAILVFFGAPTAHEDDPQRAILAGLGIVENILPYREKLRTEKGLDFNVRVGINTGLAVVGDVGSEAAGEYTAMGDAVNLAARMEQTAAPGTVQITHDTYNLVEPLFEFASLGGIPVKGKSEPVLAYQVLGQKSEPGQLRGLGGLGISSPLIGREREFEAAQAALTQLSEGVGGILAVLGEAGIGKSRLIAELRQSAAKPVNFTWMEGQSLSYGQSISYWPFQQIFRDYAGINEDDLDLEAWHKLENHIRNLFPDEVAEVLPYLASMLSINVSDEYAERVKYLDGEALGRQVYRATRLFFERLATENPLVLVFDDLHWMDASSAGLLEHLIPLVEKVPLLLCGLSRPVQQAPAAKLLETAEEQYAKQLTIIELVPLSPYDSRSLVQNLLEIDGLPDPSREMILNKADGNPFYLEEIVRELIEEGALVREPSSGRWQATQHITNVQVPDTIQGLLVARIDRLDDRLKRVVRQAAVIGRAFLYRVLNAVLDGDRDLDGHLDHLQRVELIQEKQRIPELEYIFKHALAQEAAYQGILLEERREVHARVGFAIESLMVDRLDEFYGLLAYHYTAAEHWEQAQKYLFKAGDQAGRMAADAEALDHYRQAMDAYARVHGDDRDPFERAQLERKIGEALYRLGNFSQARSYLNRSIALLGESLPESKWGTRFAIFQALAAQTFHRLFPRWFVRPMDSAPEQAVELFNAANALGWIEGVADVERLFLVSVRTLNACERWGFAYGSTNLASSFSSAVDLMGFPGLANWYADLADKYSKQIEPPRPIFQLAWGRSFHHNIQANWENSLHHARHAADIAKSTGDLRAWGSATDLAAWAHQSLGDLEPAHQASLEILEVAEEVSDLQLLSWGLLGIGVTNKRRGKLNQAIHDLERAIEASEQVPDYHTQVAASGWLGRCLVAKGQLEQAFSVLETSQGVLSASGVVIEIAILGNGFSEAYLAAAESSAGEEKQEWLNKARVSCKKALKAARRYRPPLMDALLFQGRYEYLRGNSSAAQKWWRKALEESRLLKDSYMEGMVHLEIGSRIADREHLLDAESILEEIGAEFDLRLAKEALAELDEI